MKIVIKGREAEQKSILVDTVLALLDGWNKFSKEFGKYKDIRNLELVIVDIKKGSFEFEIEPRTPDPLLAKERIEIFSNELDSFVSTFEEQDEIELSKYPEKIKSAYAENHFSMNELLKKEYSISFQINGKLRAIKQVEKTFLNKFISLKKIKEERRIAGTVHGRFIVDKKNKLKRMVTTEYLTDEGTNQITFYYIFFEDRSFRFKKPLSTSIYRTEDNVFEIPLPNTEYFAYGSSEEEVIQKFKVLIETIYDEFGLVQDEKLTEKAKEVKKFILKTIKEEEISEDI